MMSKNGISAGWCALLYAGALVSLVSTARAQGSSEMQDLTLGTPGTGQFVVGYDSTDTGDDPAGTAKRYAFPAAVWTESGANIYRASGNLGIGAAPVARPLEVYLGNPIIRLRSTTTQNTLSSPANSGSAAIEFGNSYGGWTSWGYVGKGTGATTDIYITATQGNQLFYTGGLERMRIGTSGNVGIGTSSPGSKLDVAGDTYNKNGTSATDQRLYNTYTDASNGEWLQMGWKDTANAVVINTTGNGTGAATGPARNIAMQTNGGKLGIGAAPVTRPLEVYDDYAIMRLRSTKTQDTLSSPANSGYAMIEFGNSYGGWTSWGYVGKAAGSTTDIYLTATQGNQRFYTGGLERMRIGTSGNVGIGTTSPGSKLDVAGGVTLRDRSAMTATAAQSKIWSQSGEMKVIDAAGNITTISPHPQKLMDALGVTGAAKTLGMDYTVPESGLAVAQPKARWLEWYAEIDHANGSWTKRGFTGDAIESGQSKDLIK